MTPTEIAATLERIDQLWPASDWNDAIREFVADRIRRIDITAEQALAAVDELRATTRTKTPVPADVIGRLRNALGEARREQRGHIPAGERPTWHLLRAQLGLGADAGVVEVLTRWHAGIRAKRVEAGGDAEWARRAAWTGFVAEACRSGLDWEAAAYAGDQSFGGVAPEDQVLARRSAGLDVAGAWGGVYASLRKIETALAVKRAPSPRPLRDRAHRPQLQVGEV